MLACPQARTQKPTSGADPAASLNVMQMLPLPTHSLQHPYPQHAHPTPHLMRSTGSCIWSPTATTSSRLSTRVSASNAYTRSSANTGGCRLATPTKYTRNTCGCMFGRGFWKPLPQAARAAAHVHVRGRVLWSALHEMQFESVKQPSGTKVAWCAGRRKARVFPSSPLRWLACCLRGLRTRVQSRGWGGGAPAAQAVGRPP